MPTPEDRKGSPTGLRIGADGIARFGGSGRPPQTPIAKAIAEEFPLNPIGPLLLQPAAPDWIINRTLERGSLGLLHGSPSSGKSFLALMMLCCVLLGIPFAGCKTRRGWGVYLCAEGRRAVAKRVLALGIGLGTNMEDLPLYLSQCSVPLNNELEAYRVSEAVQKLVDKLGENPSLIVIDTMARHSSADENDASQIMALINSIYRWFIERFGCAVLIVHHSGHGESHRTRGSSALPAAADYSHRVNRDGTRITMTCVKAKDTEELPALQFDLEAIDLPGWFDDFGAPVRSAYLRHVPGAPAPGVSDAPGLGKHQREALTVLRRLRDQQRQTLERGGLDPDQAQVLISEWRSASKLPRNRWGETQAALVERGLVRIQPPHAELVERPN